jgi:hypothetical protein
MSIHPLDIPPSPPYVPSMLSSEDILNELFAEQRPNGKRPLEIGYVRDLEASDHIALSLSKGSSAPPRLTRIRTTHHMLARLIAEGRRTIDASAITGFTPQRITQLKNDPAFQELIQHYTGMIQEIYVDVHSRLASVASDALEILHERLHEEPEKVKTSEIREIATMGLDRTGFGPKTTVNQNLTIARLTDANLRELKLEAEARRNGVVRTLQGAERPDERSALSTSASMGEAEKAERSEGEGTDLREEVHQVPSASPASGNGEGEPVDLLP